jgi:hypothetical protein
MTAPWASGNIGIVLAFWPGAGPEVFPTLIIHLTKLGGSNDKIVSRTARLLCDLLVACDFAGTRLLEIFVGFFGLVWGDRPK